MSYIHLLFACTLLYCNPTFTECLLHVENFEQNTEKDPSLVQKTDNSKIKIRHKSTSDSYKSGY